MLHRKSLYLALAVVAAIGTASTADAQGPRQGGFGRGGGGGFGTDPFSLLNNPAIRSELGIDQDQAQKLNELRQQMEEEARAAREKVTAQYSQKVNDLLLPHQADRLLGITVQLRGPAALQDPAVAKRIGLSESQQKELAEKLNALSERTRSAFRGQDGERPDRDAIRARFEEIQSERDGIVNSVLTSDQKKKLEELAGEEFDRSQLRQGFRRGGEDGAPGRGRRGNRGNNE